MRGAEEGEAPTGTVTVAAAVEGSGENSNMAAAAVGESWQWGRHEAMPMTTVSISWTRGSGHRTSCEMHTWYTSHPLTRRTTSPAFATYPSAGNYLMQLC